MENDFLRYSCQVKLPGFGEEAQQKLSDAKVLIVGAGGLGCPAAQYLVAAGVGTIGIADDDVISVSNLHRQILYTEVEAGQKKVLVACKKLQQQNPQVKLVPHELRINSDNVEAIVATYDLVIDCTDNFDTRYLLNDVCVMAGKPLVYGAIYQYEGQVSVWNVKNADGSFSPNYRDLFPTVDAAQVPDCAEGGVLPTLAGIIGTMQANEVIKLITGTGEVLAGQVLMLDVQTLQTRIIKIGRTTKTEIKDFARTVSVATISAAELLQHMDDYELVDVRTPEEHSDFNIGGRNIPLNELQQQVSSLKTDRPIVFYCATGKRSAEAVKLAASRNTNVFSLEGGVKMWKELSF
jgi:molybdopterin/thiamine biosynthesis adenylyltransferase/rhodanese-related sulfurtransferase